MAIRDLIMRRIVANLDRYTRRALIGIAAGLMISGAIIVSLSYRPPDDGSISPKDPDR